MGEVHSLSLSILTSLEEDEVATGVAAAACALTIGRLMTPKIMSQNEEVSFTKNLLDYLALYFSGGEGGRAN